MSAGTAFRRERQRPFPPIAQRLAMGLATGAGIV
jgi:hypothetical protein